MNWKLVARLSLAGLVMALATVFVLPSKLDSLLWFLIYLYYAYRIGKRCRGWRFLNGFVLGLINGMWIVLVHAVFFDRYLVAHPREVATLNLFREKFALHWSDQTTISALGAGGAVITGIIIGMFAVVAGLMVKPKPLEMNHDQTA